jgi:NAD(P)-dependent dehydrogenase (short-subunit alcohol dehydrogenase family)
LRILRTFFEWYCDYYRNIYRGIGSPPRLQLFGKNTLRNRFFLWYAQRRRWNRFTLENAIPVFLDVTNQSQVDRVIANMKESGIPLDGVFNKALPNFRAGGLQYRWHFDVHVLGMHRLTQAAIPLLCHAKGRVILMSSTTYSTVV